MMRMLFGSCLITVALGLAPVVAVGDAQSGSVSKVEMAMFTLPVQRHIGSQTSQ